MATEPEVEAQIQDEIDKFVDSMSALGITVTEDEIEERRRTLESVATGNAIVSVNADGVPDVETWEEVGRLEAGSVLTLDDFQKVDDKKLLVNVPFYAKQWWFTEGEMGPFVVVRCISSRPIYTPAGDTSKLILTDGSTGIYKQLREFTKRTGQTHSLVVRNGLRRSEYTADTEEGPKQAETFYLT